MTRKALNIGLALAIGFQLLVLVGMLVKAALPLWTGIEIRVQTIPVDPRSLFRGNYARLNYPFSQLTDSALSQEGSLRVGEVVYVTLESDESGLYRFREASLEKPASGVFLRGRVSHLGSRLLVRYGIEAYFAPKQEALRLEKDLADGGVAVLMLADSGRATLKAVEATP